MRELQQLLFAGLLFALHIFNPFFQAEDTIAQRVSEINRLSTMADAIQAAGLADTLRGEGTYTIFAPSNEAFENLPEGQLEELMAETNRELLADIIGNHIITGQVTTSDIKSNWEAQTIIGRKIALSVSNGDVQIEEATLTEANITASNGVIHIIDEVIISADPLDSDS